MTRMEAAPGWLSNSMRGRDDLSGLGATAEYRNSSFHLSLHKGLHLTDAFCLNMEEIHA